MGSLPAKELDARQRREQAKFREANRQAEQIQKQIHDEKEANAAVLAEVERNKLQAILIREGKV